MRKNSLWTLIPYRNKFVLCSEPSRAVIYFKNYSLDLLTQKKRPAGITEFYNELEKIDVSATIASPRVMQLFYELGYDILHLDKGIDDDTPLAIDIHYENFQKINKLPSTQHKQISYEAIYEVSEKDYENQFSKGYDHLLRGDCYQFNLTNQFIFEVQEDLDPFEFVCHLWRDSSKRGAYGSATYIPCLEKLYFSNSPECLFQISHIGESVKLSSMPIKGTVTLENKKDFALKWNELIHCEKNESELLMITDLLRNDLSSIDRPNSKVEQLKAPLIVPGLLHQYSKISIELRDNVNLMNVISSLFPGGSITGAPKKRVMQILNELETVSREFYCGSTIILFQNLKAASINIRSCIYDFDSHILSYGAGGGITLQSSCADELKESKEKLNSFKTLLIY